jgi:hypothetical protein
MLQCFMNEFSKEVCVLLLDTINYTIVAMSTDLTVLYVNKKYYSLTLYIILYYSRVSYSVVHVHVHVLIEVLVIYFNDIYTGTPSPIMTQ